MFVVETGEGRTRPETRLGCTGGRELGWDRNSATSRPPHCYLGDSARATVISSLLVLVLTTFGGAIFSYGVNAAELVISDSSVKYHLRNILDKSHLENRAGLIAYVARRGLRETTRLL